MIAIVCPNPDCRKPRQVTEFLVGMTVICTGCKTPILVAVAEPPASPAPAVAPVPAPSSVDAPAETVPQATTAAPPELVPETKAPEAPAEPTPTPETPREVVSESAPVDVPMASEPAPPPAPAPVAPATDAEKAFLRDGYLRLRDHPIWGAALRKHNIRTDDKGDVVLDADNLARLKAGLDEVQRMIKNAQTMKPQLTAIQQKLEADMKADEQAKAASPGLFTRLMRYFWPERAATQPAPEKPVEVKAPPQEKKAEPPPSAAAESVEELVTQIGNLPMEPDSLKGTMVTMVQALAKVLPMAAGGDSDQMAQTLASSKKTIDISAKLLGEGHLAVILARKLLAAIASQKPVAKEKASSGDVPKVDLEAAPAAPPALPAVEQKPAPAPPPDPAKQARARARELNDAAIRAVRAGDNQTAMKSWVDAAKADPTFSGPPFNMARFMLDKGARRPEELQVVEKYLDAAERNASRGNEHEDTQILAQLPTLRDWLASRRRTIDVADAAPPATPVGAKPIPESDHATQRDQLLRELRQFSNDNNAYATRKAIAEVDGITAGFPHTQARTPMREQIRGDFQTYPMWEAATLTVKQYVPWKADYMSAEDCTKMSEQLLAVAGKALHWLQKERAGFVANEFR